MADTKVFEKILRMKDRERKAAQQAFTEKQEQFEIAATNLYELLKKKEDAEALLTNGLAASLPIQRLSEHHAFLETVNRQIDRAQIAVQFARTAMLEKQELLSEAYIEVKKIDKLIEKKRQEAWRKLQEEENKQMDDLSIRQFLANGAR
ncbi:flagellar export protein FliJ [Terribacillus sp. DMT04]|uniref:flagellar export protein FliJ n=1 Tax=Terribacillus sp. DMT04 TaxID=2850441 RepID=UPI001C2B7F56|nr:flagellar export protein FliJ [Terribacillus sp. DMT04]QXE03098.1 flagellar export protein FliJ [Terribacillus sp. DMT04]